MVPDAIDGTIQLIHHQKTAIRMLVAVVSDYRDFVYFPNYRVVKKVSLLGSEET